MKCMDQIQGQNQAYNIEVELRIENITYARNTIGV